MSVMNIVLEQHQLHVSQINKLIVQEGASPNRYSATANEDELFLQELQSLDSLALLVSKQSNSSSDAASPGIVALAAAACSAHLTQSLLSTSAHYHASLNFLESAQHSPIAAVLALVQTLPSTLYVNIILRSSSSSSRSRMDILGLGIFTRMVPSTSFAEWGGGLMLMSSLQRTQHRGGRHYKLLAGSRATISSFYSFFSSPFRRLAAWATGWPSFGQIVYRELQYRLDVLHAVRLFEAGSLGLLDAYGVGLGSSPTSSSSSFLGQSFLSRSSSSSSIEEGGLSAADDTDRILIQSAASTLRLVNSILTKRQEIDDMLYGKRSTIGDGEEEQEGHSSPLTRSKVVKMIQDMETGNSLQNKILFLIVYSHLLISAL